MLDDQERMVVWTSASLICRIGEMKQKKAAGGWLFFLLLSSLKLIDTSMNLKYEPCAESMSLKYEPSSEPFHISAK